jgi:phosphoribosylformylglycinamidine cyclo-ligase
MGPIHYRDAGVDIDAGNDAVRRIKALARQTYTPGVLSGVGAFGGLFALDPSVPDPVLVASADGVGTKLKVAFLAGRHDTIGIDLVNHCVNDVLVQGARPLFFLDYLATPRLAPSVAEEIVRGIAAACRENGCALLGGETAEMPGFYADGEYDLAGFIVGLVARSRIVDGRDIQAGDALLRPHRSYLRAVTPALERGWIKGMAHITGGGIVENLPRTLPEGRSFAIDRDSWAVPPLFRWLQQAGRIDDPEMIRTFNMGVGLIVVCSPERAGDLLGLFSSAGEAAWNLGRVV